MSTCDRESAISTRIRGAWSHSDAAYIGFVMEQGVVKPPDDGILMPSLRVGAGSGMSTIHSPIHLCDHQK